VWHRNIRQGSRSPSDFAVLSTVVSRAMSFYFVSTFATFSFAFSAVKPAELTDPDRIAMIAARRKFEKMGEVRVHWKLLPFTVCMPLVTENPCNTTRLAH